MSLDRFARAFVVVFLLLALDAPDARAAQDSLADAKGLKCEFPLHAVGTWRGGEPHAEIRTSTLLIAFKEIDVRDGFATAVGGFGPPSINVRLSAGSLHLMQVGSSASLYVTTVFSKATREGWLFAAHTRHEYTEVSVPGYTSRPEQYYGECQVEQ